MLEQLAKHSALVKIERSENHISYLSARVREFVASNPYRFAVERDPDTKAPTLVLRVDKDMPVDFAPIIGDAIHNLSSALDHIVFDLVKPDNAAMERRVQFPFCKDAASLEPTLKTRFIQRAPKEAIDIIRAVQPYPGGNGALLHAIHDLDITDKHKLLVTVTGMTGVNNADVVGTSGTVMMLRNMRIGPIKDGLKIIQVGGANSQLNIDENIKPAFEITFGDGPLWGKEVFGALREFVAQVADVVVSLEPFA